MDDAFEYVVIKEEGRFKTGVETTAQYFKRTVEPSFVEERSRFNKCFNEYPQEEREEIKRRLSSNREVYYDIYYELLLFQLFKKQGFTVSIHPRVPKSLKCPDFLIEKGSFKCYVEATSIRRMADDEKRAEKNKELVYQAINGIDTKGYILFIEDFSLNTSRTVSGKSIASQVVKGIEEGIKHLLASFIFEIANKDYFLYVRATYIGGEYNPFENRHNIGAYGYSFYWGNRNSVFCKGFKEKAARYGALDYPYIVCVNSLHFLTQGDWEDIDEMLMKNLNLRNVDREEEIFSFNNSYTHKRVSAILFTQGVEFPYKDSTYRFVLHPKADLPIDILDFSLANHYIVNGKIVRAEGKIISELVYPHLYEP